MSISHPQAAHFPVKAMPRGGIWYVAAGCSKNTLPAHSICCRRSHQLKMRQCQSQRISLAFNQMVPGSSNCRLVRDGAPAADRLKLTFSPRDIVDINRLTLKSEKRLRQQRIDVRFSVKRLVLIAFKVIKFKLNSRLGSQQVHPDRPSLQNFVQRKMSKILVSAVQRNMGARGTFASAHG